MSEMTSGPRFLPTSAMVRRVWFLLFDQFQLLDVCGPLQVFATANEECQLTGEVAAYQPGVYSIAGGHVTSSSSVALDAGRLPSGIRQAIHTVVVPGGPGAWNPTGYQSPERTDDLVLWLRRNAPRIERLASVCTGAFVLARTGLLDGRRAVTHWAACEALRHAAPEIEVQRDAIFFTDGPYWTSAGVTSGIDMALGMVEADVGRAIAMRVAKKLVVFYKRPGGQSQFSSALLEQTAGDARVAELHAWIALHLRDHIPVNRMAECLAMSPRTFARFYFAATGTTPAHAVEQIRLEQACRLMESQQRMSVKAIAQQCGFSSGEVMRRTFVRHLKVSPIDYRQRFSGR